MFLVRTEPWSFLSAEIVLHVPIRDLATGREPHVLPRSNMRERLSEVLTPVGMPDKERVQADSHDSPGLGAVFVQNVELITNHAPEGLGTLFQIHKSRDVI